MVDPSSVDAAALAPEPAFARLIEPLMAGRGSSEAAVHGVAFTLAFVVISFLHVVIGEQGPKAAAIQHPERTALIIAFPLRVFYVICYPAIWVMNAAANG